MRLAYNVSEIVDRAAIGGDKRRIKGVNKAKGKFKFNRVVPNSHKKAGYRLDNLPI